MSESDHALAEVLEYVSELEADIPGVRSWVGGILIGKIPLTDEVTVYELADLWGDVQDILTTVSADAQNLMAPLLESWSGDAAVKFGQWWEGYLQGLDGLVQNAAQTQQGVQNFGLQIETMKFMAVLGLIMMLITIVQLIAMAWGTLGISAAGVWPTIQATRVALIQVAKNVIASIARISWESVGTFLRGLIELSPKQIVARSVADAIITQGGKFLPDEVLTVLKEMAPEGVGDLMEPAMAQVRNELRDALVQAQLRAWTEAGTSLAATTGDDLLGQWASRQIGEQTFAKAMWLYLRPRILNGIAFMGGGNLAAQLFEFAGGERKGLDLGELTTSAAQGAVFGAAMWGSPAGHVIGSTAASTAFALVGDALKGGVDDKGKPVDWLGDALSGARSGFEAGVVFGIHSTLPEMHLGADPVMPEGGRVTGIGELDGVLTINVERDGVQVMARPDYVTVSDTNSGAKLVVRGDGTFDQQGEFSGRSGFSGTRPEPVVVEADPPGTTYERPTATEAVVQETETPVETPAETPAETPTSGAGTQGKQVVVEADAQPKQAVVEADAQPKQAVESEPSTAGKAVAETSPEPATASPEPHIEPTVEPAPPRSQVDLSAITSQTDVSAMTSISRPPDIVNMATPPPWHGSPFADLLNEFPLRADVLGMMHRSGVDADVFRQALQSMTGASPSELNSHAALMAVAADAHGELGLIMLHGGMTLDQMANIADLGAPADLLGTLLEPHTKFRAEEFGKLAQKLAALLVNRGPSVEAMMAAGLDGPQIVKLTEAAAAADKVWPAALAKLEGRSLDPVTLEPSGLDPSIRARLEKAGGFTGLLDKYFGTHRVRDAGGVAKYVEKAINELTKKDHVQLGMTVQFLEALDFVQLDDPVIFKNSVGLQYTMSVEGRPIDANDPLSGNADLVHVASRVADGQVVQIGAAQIKVSDPVNVEQKYAGSNLAENIRKAISQLHGEAKKPADAEIPPKEANLHAPMILVNPDDPMYKATREDILQVLAAYKTSHGISPDRMIVGTDENARAILVEIRNGTGAHLFTFDDFPLDRGIGDILGAGDGTLVQQTRSLIDAIKDPTAKPTQEALQTLGETVGKLLEAGLGTEPEHRNDLLPERYVKVLQQVSGTLTTLSGEFAPGRHPDPFARKLVDQAVAELEAALTGDLPEIPYGERPSYPHTFTPTSITKGTDQIVNQFQGFEHDHAAEAQAVFDAQKARIENQAATDTAHAHEVMQNVLEQAKNNLPARQAALDQSEAKLQQMRLRMFGEAVAPAPEVLATELQAQQTALAQLDAQHAGSLRVSASLKEASGALTFMNQLADAYQARMDAARQYLAQYDAEAAVTPSRGLLQASEARWHQVQLDRLADHATRAVREAQELRALVEHVLNQSGAPDTRLASLFADFTKSSQDQAVSTVQDALRVFQHFTDNGLTPLLQGSDHLTAVWTEQRDALAQTVRQLRAQLIDLDNRPGLADGPTKITQVADSLNQATQALQEKEAALRDQWLKDPASLPTQKAVLENQISDLRIALPEAWRRGDQAAVWSISDDLNRAEAHIAWIEQHLTQTTPKAQAGDPTAVRQALGTNAAENPASAPAFQQRYSGLTAEALRTHLDDQLSANGLKETWHVWEQRRREGYVTSITDLTDAQAKLHALLSDPAAPQSDIQAQQALVNDLAARHAAWHTYYPGDVPEHHVGADFRDVAVPGQMGDLTALGNPKDWPVAVSVTEVETPKTNFYHAHRNVLKDFFTAQTAAPDVIGGRLPVELTQETGHWKVQLSDGTVLDVRSHKPVSLVIDSGPVWRGGLSMLRLDGGLGDVGLPGHLPQLVGKVGPIALIASLSGRLGNVDLQYNPVLRRDFYSYEHVGAQTLDIKVLSDPNKRFPKRWQIETPGQGTVLTGVEKTLNFYTKWGVQAIAVPMLQFAWGDPAHGLDSLVPFLQIGGVGVAQITGEVVNVSDATTLQPLRTEWSVGAEWLVGDFISLPSHIGGVRLHPDVSRLGGWDPGPGTVMTNYVKGFDLTPFVKHYGAPIVDKTPWLGDVLRRRAAARQAVEDAQRAAIARHDNEVRQHLKTLKEPGSGEQR